MEIKVEVLTPAAAREIVEQSRLDGYGHREKIDRYKAWMREGKWSLFYNGTSPRFLNDPLIFVPGGRLFEGKHRVIALAELDDDVEVPFWVLRDFTAHEEFARWMDDVKNRRLPKMTWQPNRPPPRPLAVRAKAAEGGTPPGPEPGP